MNNISVAKNFKLYEFECKDGSHIVKLDENLVEKLQRLRELVNKPIVITSAYRTPAYNASVEGSPKSQHMEGKACDIKISGLTPSQVAKLAEQVGFTGIGIYKTFTHVDVRATKARWTDSKID
jgi:uncharacterized protein YcbK (DUF882 family)